MVRVKVKWGDDTLPEEKRYWHRWFAWYPVCTIKNNWVSFVPVERRGIYRDTKWYWEYKRIMR